MTCAHVVGEAHIEQFIYLIKDEDPYTLQLYEALIHDIGETAWGGNQDIDVVGDGPDLRLLAHAAEDHSVPEPDELAVDGKALVYLGCALSSGASTTAGGVPCIGSLLSPDILWIIGSTKAAAFTIPVRAMPIRSLPFNG